jgi:hypothetical protein
MHPRPGRSSVAGHTKALLGLERWTSKATAPHRDMSPRRLTPVSATSLKAACLTRAPCRPGRAGCWRITSAPGRARLRRAARRRPGGPPLPTENCLSASSSTQLSSGSPGGAARRLSWPRPSVEQFLQHAREVSRGMHDSHNPRRVGRVGVGQEIAEARDRPEAVAGAGRTRAAGTDRRIGANQTGRSCTASFNCSAASALSSAIRCKATARSRRAPSVRTAATVKLLLDAPYR